MGFQTQELDHTTGQKPDEHCAVVGFRGNENAFYSVLLSLRSLQHRGQESAGIATFDGSVMNLKKGMGLVSDVFPEREGVVSNPLTGNVGIGHTRYSTQGTKTLENAGPFVVSNTMGYMAISHNGEITNADSLKEELKRKGSVFQTSSDTEVMLILLSREISEKGLKNGFRSAVSKLKGSYAAALMINDRLFAMRDPLGIRPLVVGKVNDSHLIASESCVFDVIGGELLRNIAPGEIAEIKQDGVETVVSSKGERLAHCMFEYVYFARPDSIIDGVEVFSVRTRIGELLAKEYPVEADVVIPVPDSGRAQALGYSMASGIQYSEGLIKNRYSARTFIMPTQKSRTSAVKLKLNTIKSAVNGKRVVLVDDSIIRGNTLKHVVALLRKNGAREVHLRIGCPPVVAPCYFGVDMKTRDQFFAAGRSIEQMRDELGADSLGYLSISNLTESIGMGNDSLCLGCLTGVYPVSIPGEKYLYQTELEGY
ncbi:MAG: amidophosphoribosyltransferase [Candidatus Thermoplasmatota archaeon]|nr:amidophosphoribosyltransferase [Candidatus Thermoplasmatota archaeon]MCL5794213.1 amidophosphoribosyltransferase [Candidatus Thermoplasmatota archaeon]